MLARPEHLSEPLYGDSHSLALPLPIPSPPPSPHSDRPVQTGSSTQQSQRAVVTTETKRARQ